MSNSYGEITAFISEDCKLNGFAIAKALNHYTWIQHSDYFSWRYDENSNQLINLNALNSIDPSLFPEKIIYFSVYKDDIDDYISIKSEDLNENEIVECDIEESKNVSLDVIINDLSQHIYSGFIQLNLRSENFSRGYSMIQQILIKPNNYGTRIHCFYDNSGESGFKVENVINGVLI